MVTPQSPSAYSLSQEKSPLRFSDIFPKWLGIVSPNFITLLYVPIYATNMHSIICNFDEVMPY